MKIKLGLDCLLDEQVNLVKGRRVGLIASPSSVDQQLMNTAERLYHHPDVNLVALFGPEHGLRGEAQAGDHVVTYTDARTGLPVYSLYGETRKPSADMLQDLDTLIFDLQDGGVRFYTYVATLSHVMEAAAENGIAVIVIDRPTPINGQVVSGPILDPAYTSFVGPHPIPIRPGMTMGELARLFNEAFLINCDLTVVPMSGWQRNLWFDQTSVPFVPPSPNLPTLSALTLYPGTCLIEGTNLSEGRGTTKPFEYLGAPWINAETFADDLNTLHMPGVRFRPVYFVPTFSKYQGEVCAGVQVFVTNRDLCEPIEVTLTLIAVVKASYPAHFAWRDPWSEESHYPIDLLSGGQTMRQHLDADQPVKDLIGAWQDDLQTFIDLRANFVLY